MFCVKCGKQLPDDLLFCTQCGTPTSRNSGSVSSCPTETIAADVVDCSSSNISSDKVASAPEGQPAGFRPTNNQQTGFTQSVSSPVVTAKDSVQVNDKKTPAIIAAAVAAVTVVLVLVVIVVIKPFGSETTADTQTVTIGSSETGTVDLSSSGSSEDTKTEDTNTITLTVKTADGETLSGEVRRDENDYVLPDSSSREYSYSEISEKGLNGAELCIAWNEPFARQGYHFKNPDLQKYFEGCSWYQDSYNSSSLSGVAATNNTTLRSMAEADSQNAKWMDLATS